MCLDVAKTYALPLAAHAARGIQLEATLQDAELEARVTDNSRAITATLTGAVIGGVAGYFFFTARGRELRRQIEPAIDDFVRELNSFRATVEKAGGAAGQGWKMLNEAMDSGPQNIRHQAPHQTSPF